MREWSALQGVHHAGLAKYRWGAVGDWPDKKHEQCHTAGERGLSRSTKKKRRKSENSKRMYIVYEVYLKYTRQLNAGVRQHAEPATMDHPTVTRLVL
jgi:hypothetical protein